MNKWLFEKCPQLGGKKIDDHNFLKFPIRNFL